MSLPVTPNAQQGHRYAITQGPHAGQQVLALSSGPLPRVAPLLAAAWPFLGEPFVVSAAHLQPLPMTYFHGQAPAMT
jgi:hypothetical protein